VHNVEKGTPGREAASAAMRSLLGPIIGHAGADGGVRAGCLKPTQCAMWLRPQVPPERRNVFYRGFNRAYAWTEHWYARLVARMVHRSAAFARELRAEGREIQDAALEAARARFRPILMTSFAFILGVAPLVLASGAGASARVSIGITVFTGMIASTCLAVLFVPPFFVMVQRLEEWLKVRKGPLLAGTTVG
jgi:multidrug efflux pump subunit AcrB